MIESKDQVKYLKAWGTQTEHEIRDILEAMVPLQKRLEAAKVRLDLIQRLIRLAEKDLLVEMPESELRNQSSSKLMTTQSNPNRISVDFEEHMEQILEKAGEPMHIKDLRHALINQGMPLPGRGDEANIILRLRRAEERFTRTGRGTYGLAKWGLPEVKPTKKKRTRRKVGRGVRKQ